MGFGSGSSGGKRPDSQVFDPGDPLNRGARLSNGKRRGLSDQKRRFGQQEKFESATSFLQRHQSNSAITTIPGPCGESQ